MDKIKNNFQNVNLKNQVVSAFAEFIKETSGIDQMFYSTFTFKPANTKTGSVHPERADKSFRYFLIKANQGIYGYHNWYKKKSNGLIVARATEIGKIGSHLHYHALISRVPENIQPSYFKELWEDNGFSKIEICKNEEDARAYIAKDVYVSKGGQIDFFGPWKYRRELTQSYREKLTCLSPQGNLAYSC